MCQEKRNTGIFGVWPNIDGEGEVKSFPKVRRFLFLFPTASSKPRKVWGNYLLRQHHCSKCQRNIQQKRSILHRDRLPAVVTSAQTHVWRHYLFFFYRLARMTQFPGRIFSISSRKSSTLAITSCSTRYFRRQKEWQATAYSAGFARLTSRSGARIHANHIQRLTIMCAWAQTQ